MFPVGVSTIKELVYLFTVLKRRYGLFVIIRGDEEKQFVGCKDDQLYTFEATAIPICGESSPLV